jgi:tRNA uridine 5-carboxymethylaminomethyl modification enzyme
VDFDVIIVGAGHAGCEAAAAAARMGKRVLLTTIDLNSVGYMPCNPSIGGVGKSHLVYEIDALGGVMAQTADKTCIQMRTLNAGNGPAVRALRAQIDKHDYHKTMLETMKSYPQITILECEITHILTKNNKITGVKIAKNSKSIKVPEQIFAPAVVIATGVYLNSCVLVGHTSRPSGPVGFEPANHLTASLCALGVTVRRFKTGTPPRVASASIDYAKTTPQPPDTDAHFGFLTTEPTRNLVACHLTYTNEKTHKIIRDNIKKSAMYGGLIKGVGARYCPSIEDKITRFATAARHQIFLEPESLSTDEIYLQGISTSLPADVQKEFVQTIDGLENAEILRSAYAIEYDCIDSLQLKPTLEHKNIRGLFFAGQVNGTSGYEEAAAQGLVAGANAGLLINGRELVLSRTQSYIGVLISDLTTVGTNEPYRMFTSRAEHRLHLRQDNADQRLTPLGREVGLVDDTRWASFQEKMKLLSFAKTLASAELAQVIACSDFSLLEQSSPLRVFLKDKSPIFFKTVLETLENEKKYSGYLKREEAKIADMQRLEKTVLPDGIDYMKITALRKESQIKLSQIRPHDIAAAMRISGVTPADINVLLVYLKRTK